MSWGPEVSVFWQIFLIYSDTVHASSCSTFTLEDTLSFTQKQSVTQESPRTQVLMPSIKTLSRAKTPRCYHEIFIQQLKANSVNLTAPN